MNPNQTDRQIPVTNNAMSASSVQANVISVPMRIGFGTRFGAMILDYVINAAVGVAIGILAGGYVVSLGQNFINQLPPQFHILLGLGFAAGTMAGILMGFVLMRLINSLIECFYGASIAAMILGIRVATVPDAHPNMGRYILRWIIKNILYICVIIAIIAKAQILVYVGDILGLIVFIGFFFVLGPGRQTLHDMIAGTSVFRRADIK